MTKQEQVILKLLMNDKLKKYDTINLECIGFHLKHGRDIVMHNETPTLTTKCEIAVVIGGY